MHFVAFIEFEEKIKKRLPTDSTTYICTMDGITEKGKGERWLRSAYGSIAKEITMCDDSGKETIVK